MIFYNKISLKSRIVSTFRHHFNTINLMKKTFTILVFIFAFQCLLFSQEDKKYFYLNWGYNRSAYTKSDINFSGKGYQFTLNSVVAKDRQTPLNRENLFGTYLNIKYLSIPQYNLRIGKRVSERWAFSVGTDHMKYVMVTDQVVKIEGEIAAQVSSPSIDTKQYAGKYTGQDIKLSPDFLRFEHTDGYNVVSIDADRYINLYREDEKHFSLVATIGAGISMVVPRSDVHLFDVGANHNWNISGEGAVVKTSLQLHFNKRIFLEMVGKSGFTYLHAIPTTGQKGDKATQGIGYIEGIIQLGFKL